MKKILLSFVLVFNVFSKTEVGNGGGVWTCRNDDDSIRWIQLVDFFEGEVEFGLKIYDQYAGMSKSEIINSILEFSGEIDPNFEGVLSRYLSIVEESLEFKNSELEVIDDSLYRIRPSRMTCVSGNVNYEQLANYTTDGRILISDLYDSDLLSETDKAGLLIHEAIYLFLRESRGETNSVNTRKVLAYLFSDESAQNVMDVLVNYFNLNRIEINFIDHPGGEVACYSESVDCYRDPDIVNMMIPVEPFEVMDAIITQYHFVTRMGFNTLIHDNDLDTIDRKRPIRRSDCPLEYEEFYNEGTNEYIPMCANSPLFERISAEEFLEFVSVLEEERGERYRLPTVMEWMHMINEDLVMMRNGYHETAIVKMFIEDYYTITATRVWDWRRPTTNCYYDGFCFDPREVRPFSIDEKERPWDIIESYFISGNFRLVKIQ